MRNRRSREADNEGELSILVLLVTFASLTTVPILAPAGYSLAGKTCEDADELRIGELLSGGFVNATLTKQGEPAELTLCTKFLALHKALISSALNRILRQRERYLGRPNLERSKVSVNNSSPH